ncbi:MULTISPECIES: hypothetical protein [unclassified Streptomyces]|uniref:hypothetical protein n=1 Tax=unclassified Streptomyces TaxID=2593676 RepID=UPI00136F1127|nr:MULTISPECIES: hypothetical protein [unclassified Streptomyces]MYQ82264.1 hypothetical protein [Streptomyces sp. SID4936]
MTPRTSLLSCFNTQIQQGIADDPLNALLAQGVVPEHGDVPVNDYFRFPARAVVTYNLP